MQISTKLILAAQTTILVATASAPVLAQAAAAPPGSQPAPVPEASVGNPAPGTPVAAQPPGAQPVAPVAAQPPGAQPAPAQPQYVYVPVAYAGAPNGPPPAPPPPEPPYDRRVFGLGYKIGNGIGFLGGDLIIAPIDHLALDLQASYADSGGATGYGLAPSIQFQFNAAPKPTPYIGVGLQYVKMSLGDVTGSATGFFANVGYEWRWRSGLGVLLGGGIQHLGNIEITDGTDSYTFTGGTNLNLEAGIRYLFF